MYLLKSLIIHFFGKYLIHFKQQYKIPLLSQFFSQNYISVLLYLVSVEFQNLFTIFEAHILERMLMIRL